MTTGILTWYCICFHRDTTECCTELCIARDYKTHHKGLHIMQLLIMVYI